MANHHKAKQGAVLLVLIFFLFGHVAATQWFAHHIHYEETFLGEPLVVDEGVGVKIYAPYRIYSWYRTYQGEGVDDLFAQSFGALGATCVLGMIAGALCLVSLRGPKEYTSHGSARWARPDEIQEWGLLDSPTDRLSDKTYVASLKKKGEDPEKVVSSVCFAKNEKGRYFYNSGPEHVLAFAPTRSGKGVGMVIPTLLTWTESVVITDIKGENFQITSWWRSLFSHIIYFNPTDPHSAKFNPLLEIRRGPEAIKDAMNLAEILGARPKGKEQPFWDGGTKKFLSAIMLFVLYTHEDKSLGRCIKLLMRGDEIFEMMLVVDIEDQDVQEYLRGVAKGALEKDEKLRGGFLEGADGMLNLWKDPIVARNTATSDFRLRDLQYAHHPISMFLVIPPGDLKRLSPLIRLFFQQLTDRLTERLDDEAGGERHRLLMLMDEFPQFGNMEKIEKAISYTAGYGIKWFFVTQGLPQLDDIYGNNNGFLSNCHTRLAYRCNEDKNALRLSKMLGEATGFKEQEGQSGRKGVLATLSNKSVSKVEFARPLMTPGELMQLQDDRLVVMIAGKYPTLANKLTYYDDPFFIPRYKKRKWEFPTEPLDDFPSVTVTHDWVNLHDVKVVSHLASSSAEPTKEEEAQAAQASHDAMARLHKASKTRQIRYGEHEGEAPYVSPFKADAADVQDIEVHPHESAREAQRRLTTTSIRREDIDLMIQRGIKAGLFNQEHLAQFLTPHTSPPPSRATSSQDKVSPEPVESKEAFNPEDPFGFAQESPSSPPEEEVVDDLDDILSSLPPAQMSEPQPSVTELVPDMEARIKALVALDEEAS